MPVADEMVRDTFRCDNPSLFPISVWVKDDTYGKTPPLTFRAVLSPASEPVLSVTA